MPEKGWGIAGELVAVAAMTPISLGAAVLNKLTGGKFDDGGMLHAAAKAAGEFGDNHNKALTTGTRRAARAFWRASVPGPTP